MICCAEHPHLQLISTFTKGISFPVCVIYICSKYAWLIPFKDKKGITITNDFQKGLKKFNRKPNKIWLIKALNFVIDQWNYFCGKKIEMYSTHNECRSAISERFISTVEKNITSLP